MTDQEVVPVSSPVDPAIPVVPVIPPVRPELKAFSDVPMHLAIEIGRLQVRLDELVGLKTGRIFKIPKSAGEPFDICVNGQPIARGEVIVVENSSGVRITDVAKL